MPRQHQSQLVQRDVRLPLDRGVDQRGVVLDLRRPAIAALRLGRRRALLNHQLPPADRARSTHPEPFRRRRRDIPPSIAATTRSRRSRDSARPIPAGLRPRQAP